jgi:hypothetical protein
MNQFGFTPGTLELDELGHGLGAFSSALVVLAILQATNITSSPLIE